MAAVSIAPRNRRFGLYFKVQSTNFKTADFVAFLKQLRRQLRRPITLVWDRLAAHKSAANRLAKEGCTWLHVEYLPPYAPELDPVEYVWNHAKYTDLANFIPADSRELRSALVKSLYDQADDHWLKYSYFRSAHLAI